MAADLLPILRCPICSASLESTELCGDCGSAFLQDGGQPVLVDFEDSIFDKKDYEAPRPPSPRLSEGTAVGRFLRRLSFGTNEVAAPNARKLIGLLKSRQNPRVLVIGGGTIGIGMEELYRSEGIEIVGTDVFPSPHTRLICDGHKLPFADGTFDACIIQAVLQDCVEPHRVVAEIHRVLRPDGLVYAETSFVQHIHDGPYDFSRFTMSGHRWLFKDFDEIEAGTVLGPGNMLVWSIYHYLQALGLGPRATALATAMFWWLRPIGDLAQQKRAVNAAPGFYFLGSRSDRPMQARDLPAYYYSKR